MTVVLLLNNSQKLARVRRQAQVRSHRTMEPQLDTSRKSEVEPKTRTNVQVAVRCRPTSDDERSKGAVEVLSCDPASHEVRIACNRPQGEKSFTFDKVFGPEATQADVFEYSVAPLVLSSLQGYNATVFAYGQTGTGKTYVTCSSKL